MLESFNSRCLDVLAFANAKASLDGNIPWQALPRLAQELGADNPHEPSAPSAEAFPPLHWQATGERRSAVDGSIRPALHLRVQGRLPLTCQRCLGALDWPLHIDRHFLFVPDETTAATLDDESEDDVLVQSATFDLQALLEDEVLMDLPLVPSHDSCPAAVPMHVESEGFAEEQARVRNPFAALKDLKTGQD